LPEAILCDPQPDAVAPQYSVQAAGSNRAVGYLSVGGGSRDVLAERLPCS